LCGDERTGPGDDVSLRAGEIKGDVHVGEAILGILGFVSHERQGAKKEIADVGENGSASRRDAILGKHEKEAREEFVDVMRGLKLGEFTGEGCADVGFVESAGSL